MISEDEMVERSLKAIEDFENDMKKKNTHPCLFCGEYSIDCAYGWALAICSDCMHHTENIASGKYQNQRVVENGETILFEIHNPDDNKRWRVQRCQFNRNPHARQTDDRDRHSKNYKEATSRCEHPAFWFGSNRMQVCSYHKDGHITFANHFCEVPEYIDAMDRHIRCCANEATSTVDDLRVCKEHTPSIGPFTVDEEFDFASHFTTPSTEEEQT